MYSLKRIKQMMSVLNIYQHPNPEERIRSFSLLDTNSNACNPLPIINPPFLKQSKAKQILLFVEQHSIPNNIRILHALAHIQFNAFMSYADTFFRFRQEMQDYQTQFESDMKEVALEEGKHFMQLKGRLVQLGSDYGSLPVIPKLTLAIQQTMTDLIARIAVISLIHEGRGVKAVEKLLSQLQRAKDMKSVSVVKGIQSDEKKHFALGWKWFFLVCKLKNLLPSTVIDEINLKYKSNIKMSDNK